MSFGNSASKVYLSRAQTRAMSIEDPVGDPFGGPAFGEFNDPVSATIGSGVLGLGGAFTQANAAENAAHMQADATNTATGEQRRQYDVSRTDQMPFLQSGQAANLRLRDLLGLGVGPRASVATTGPIAQSEFDANAYLQANPDVAADAYFGQNPYEHYIRAGLNEGRQGFKVGDYINQGSGALLKPFTPGDLVNEPGYQFGLGEGNKAIDNAARSRGMYMSPATVKELLRYGQDYAGTKYNDAFNRDLTNRTTTYNLLSGTSGGGQVSANTLAGAGQASAMNIGNLVTSGANARGAAGIASANAYGNAFNTIGNNALQSSYLDRILRSRSGPFDNMPSGYGLQ